MARVNYEFPDPDFDFEFPAPLKALFWDFFNRHEDQVILRVRVGVLFIKFTQEVRLGDLRPLFESIF